MAMGLLGQVFRGFARIEKGPFLKPSLKLPTPLA